MKQLDQNVQNQEAAILEAYWKSLQWLGADYRQKCSLLQSDMIELTWQITEIEHMQLLIKGQAEDQRPISFIKLWPSYWRFKDVVLNQKYMASDVNL